MSEGSATVWTLEPGGVIVDEHVVVEAVLASEGGVT